MYLWLCCWLFQDDVVYNLVNIISVILLFLLLGIQPQQIALHNNLLASLRSGPHKLALHHGPQFQMYPPISLFMDQMAGYYGDGLVG